MLLKAIPAPFKEMDSVRQRFYYWQQKPPNRFDAAPVVDELGATTRKKPAVSPATQPISSSS
jgi:hypothetical protein